MSSSKIKQLIFLQIIASLIVGAASCNSKTSDVEEEITYTPALVAVKNFYLQANDSVLANLDSVFFSIDLNTGVIFNADSLPKGTNVNRLIPSITFANTMTKADLTFLKDGIEETTVDYLSNPSDSIDFTYPVKLDVTAQDGINSFTYTIKVNVHRQIPDTVLWDNLQTSFLPSRHSNPIAQKTVLKDQNAYCLIEEFNGEFTLSCCKDLNKGDWIQNVPIFDFNPSINSFTATETDFWIISDTGFLYHSSDGLSWTSTGTDGWMTLLGNYNDKILGIKDNGSQYLHAQYPVSEDFIETEVDSDFPLRNMSSLGIVDTDWAVNPVAILAGGVKENGDFSNAIWAYDGNVWAVLNSNVLPSLESPMLARYVVYRDTQSLFTQREFDVWLLFGGTNKSGEMNRSVYMSYDNGVTWIFAPDGMQLPVDLPSLAGADLIVTGYELSADLSEAWTLHETKTRRDYSIDGYDITWICPYLYIFGGYLTDNSLSTQIWRGVLARLEFAPQI